MLIFGSLAIAHEHDHATVKKSSRDVEKPFQDHLKPSRKRRNGQDF